MREIKRCAIYIRVSTAMQRLEGWSLDAQASSLTRTAEARGWKVVGLYADEGKSARKRLKGRREIFRLLDDVRAGLVDVILFKDLDRWFRNVSDFYKVQDVLDEYGVEWSSEQQPSLEMRTKEGRLAVNVLLSVGQNEADATSDRIKYTNKYMRSLKKFPGGAQCLPFGYTIGEGQRVVIDEKEADALRDLIEALKRLGSVRAAVLEINAKYGEILSYNAAFSMLKNTMLYGEYRGIPDFIDEPYLSRAEWDELQACLRHNASYRTSGDSALYLFTGGLARCGRCGGNFTGVVSHGIYKNYRCHRGTGPRMWDRCEFSGSISEKLLEAQLLEALAPALEDLKITIKSVEGKKKKARPVSNRAAIEKKLDRLEDLYINSDRMTKERYEEKRAAILAQLIEPEEEPEPELPSLASVEELQALLDGGLLELYKGFTDEEKRRFWRGFLDYFVVTDKKITAIYFLP